MRKLTAIALGGALFLASSGTIAGGCLQGTWTYYDDDGNFVGYHREQELHPGLHLADLRVDIPAFFPKPGASRAFSRVVPALRR
jgi:hypothetical protein